MKKFGIIEVLCIMPFVLLLVLVIINNKNHRVYRDVTINTQQEEQCTNDSLEFIRQRDLQIALDELNIESKEEYVKTCDMNVKIINAYTSAPNSAGGVDLHVIWKNCSNKTIKYITFNCIPFNAVDDQVYCDIRGYASYNGQETGPISPGITYGYNRYWDCAWYNSTIKRTEVLSIDIEYMDGSKYFIDYTAYKRNKKILNTNSVMRKIDTVKYTI